MSTDSSHRIYSIRPRLSDFSWYTGKRTFFITINTFQRRKYFTGSATVDSLIIYLKKISEQYNFTVVVYCFMPDHIHILLQGNTNNANVLQCIKMYKQHTGFLFQKIHSQPLWSTSFYDHVLRKEESIKTIGRYILLNPVRAGLTTDIRQYQFNGSFVYSLEDLYQCDPFLGSAMVDV